MMLKCKHYNKNVLLQWTIFVVEGLFFVVEKPSTTDALHGRSPSQMILPRFFSTVADRTLQPRKLVPS